MTKTLPQASNKFAQDYNNHIAFDKILRGWRVSDVVYTKSQDLVYGLVNEKGSKQELREYAKALSKRFGHLAVVDQTKQGMVLSVAGANTPPFSDGNLVTYNIRDTYALISDAISKLLPDAKVVFSHFQQKDMSSSAWRTMQLQINFTSGVIDDLLKLKAITAKLPISLASANYQISDENKLTGNVVLEIHGTEQW